MTEQEIREKIVKSAEQIVIPESIRPESIQQELKTQQQREQKRKHGRITGIAVAAAALMLVYASGLLFSFYHQGEQMAALGEEAADAAERSGTDGAAEEDMAAVWETEEETEKGAQSDALEQKKTDAGDLYAVAKDYGEVYELAAAQSQSNLRYDVYDLGVVESVDGAESDFTTDISTDASTYVTEDARVDVTEDVAADVIEDAADESVSGSGSNYSGTNLQVADVDESDIIKTDGSYIYTVNGDTVTITDVSGSNMQAAGEIEVSINNAADCILEMYIDGDILNLIVERQETGLEKTADVYYVNANTVTELLTYDISERSQPVLTGTVSQDGSYRTSRKIGDIVYLFTNQKITRPDLAKEEAVSEENAGGWIPLVNGAAISADCIYLPDTGSQGLIISSTDVNQPDEVVDNTLILNNYVNIYVSSEALYLYGENYSDGAVATDIAKFSLADGKMNAVGATSVSGEVSDTFAVNEYQGKLRVLTTDWSGDETENRLFLFDDNLTMTGKLEELAVGEEIYAARFFGDTAYFVTYRNTDPLFAVDLSDEENPVILSELEITGFSEYLHFWGEDKLVGIGYETDPDDGEILGIKLVMFDISNPAEVKTLGTCVIANADYSPALYQYKCVLADADENMIGFSVEAYGQERTKSYLLFSWEDGEFQEIMSESLDAACELSEYRGMYIGDTFYLVEPGRIFAYDRNNEYDLKQKLEL